MLSEAATRATLPGDVGGRHLSRSKPMTKLSQPEFTHRLAQPADVPAIVELMQMSIAENMKSYLSAAEIESARETMSVDWTLIDDRTYFLIEAIEDRQSVLVGCGGWGKRRTLYGGDHTAGRDDSYSDPAVDAAREAGFKRIELGSTIPGEPIYLARGYKEIRRVTNIAANGAANVVIRMSKYL